MHKGILEDKKCPRENTLGSRMRRDAVPRMHANKPGDLAQEFFLPPLQAANGLLYRGHMHIQWGSFAQGLARGERDTQGLHYTREKGLSMNDAHITRVTTSSSTSISSTADAPTASLGGSIRTIVASRSRTAYITARHTSSAERRGRAPPSGSHCAT